MSETLTVEEVFDITGIGLVVASPSTNELEELGFELGEYPVELRRPDGSRETTRARFQTIFVNPAPADGPTCAVILLDLAKVDVPIGSKISRG